MRLETAIREYLTFLRSPQYDYKRSASLDWITITKLFFFVFAVEMLVLIPMSSFMGLEEIPHIMESLMMEKSFWFIALMAIVIAPIAEEIIFRLHLRYHWLTFLYLIILLLVVLFFGLKYAALDMVSGLGEVQQQVLDNGFLRTVLLVTILTIVAMSYLLSKGFESQWMQRIFPFIFYMSAAVFALVHISNFELPEGRWYLTPLLVMPQFILACYLGYVRVRNNVIASIYVHALNNSIPMLLYAMASSLAPVG